MRKSHPIIDIVCICQKPSESIPENQDFLYTVFAKLLELFAKVKQEEEDLDRNMKRKSSESSSMEKRKRVSIELERWEKNAESGCIFLYFKTDASNSTKIKIKLWLQRNDDNNAIQSLRFWQHCSLNSLYNNSLFKSTQILVRMWRYYLYTIIMSNFVEINFGLDIFILKFWIVSLRESSTQTRQFHKM